MSGESRVRSVGSALRQVVIAVQDQRVTFLAAAVAYYAFVSLIPALLLLLVVTSTILGDAFAETLLEATGEFLTPAGRTVVETAVASAAGRSGATLLGLGVLVWSTLRVFRALDTAFLEVYGVDETVSFLDQFVDAASAVIAIGAGLVAMFAVGTVIVALDVVPTIEIVSFLLLPAVLTIVFLPMYYLLPYPDIRVRDAVPGAVFTAIGWTALQAGFQLYAVVAGQYQVYGMIGGILLLVTWLYIAAIIVIVGAVLNVVLAADGDVPSTLRGSAGSGPSPLSAVDRQLQHGSVPHDRMGERESETDSEGDPEVPRGAPDVTELDAELRRLRAELDAFETDVERRTVDRPALERELKSYVRARMRRGHAHGWGPYLVLLYGTVLTLGAFYFLDGIYAIAAMVVLGLSTLGLYTLFILVGIALNAFGIPGKAIGYVRSRKEE